MTQDSVDELDLALINALQLTPRASWSRLGRTLGVDPVTAARRWERLREAGLAWVTCSVGPALHHAFCMAYIEIACRPGTLGSVAAALSGLAETRYVHHLTGDRPLLAVVGLPAPSDLACYLSEVLDTMPGVLSHRAELRTAGYGEPGRWRLRSLEPAQKQALEPGGPPPRTPPPAARVDALDRTLYRLLHEDGRMPFAALASRAGISEATARRRVGRLLDTRSLRLRCEAAQSITGWPVTAVLRASVPPADLDATARSLAALPDVRLCCSLTGPRNLLLMLWLRDLRDLPRVEASLTGQAPALTLHERAICLHTPNQMGRLLTPDGRATGYVAPFSG